MTTKEAASGCGMTLGYNTDDDGVHLRCICGWEAILGFDADPHEAARLADDHLDSTSPLAKMCEGLTLEEHVTLRDQLLTAGRHAKDSTEPCTPDSPCPSCAALRRTLLDFNAALDGRATTNESSKSRVRLGFYVRYDVYRCYDPDDDDPELRPQYLNVTSGLVAEARSATVFSTRALAKGAMHDFGSVDGRFPRIMTRFEKPSRAETAETECGAARRSAESEGESTESEGA